MTEIINVRHKLPPENTMLILSGEDFRGDFEIEGKCTIKKNKKGQRYPVWQDKYGNGILGAITGWRLP